jgi:8-hydroxy-5-deazaflavin:NADPH oxidoreductase
MNIAVLGTGSVGQTVGSKWIALGHQVYMGSRTATNAKAKAFAEAHPGKAFAGTFAEAAAFGDILVNCTAGLGSVEALQLAGNPHLKGKILIDLSNPLDFSKGMPPTLSVVNTQSLAEVIQETFPELRVVKTLNTMWAGLMVNPGLVNGGDHQVFMSGNDASAKAEVKTLLMDMGWWESNIMDLGDLSTARGTEMYLPLWLRMYGVTKTGAFNIKFVTA